MKRLSRILALTLVVATALLLVGCGAEKTTETKTPEATETTEAPKVEYTFKFTSPNAASGVFYEGGLYLEEQIEEKTNGRVDVAFYPAGQLADKQASLEGAQLGTIEIAEVAASDLAQYDIIWDVLSLPYLFESGKQAIEVLKAPKVEAIIEQSLADAGFVLLHFKDCGARSIISTTKPVNTPADLDGMKIRLMGSPGLITAFEGFGAAPVSLAWSECYTAMQQKTVDAIENSVPVLVGDGYHEVGKYFSDTKHFIVPNVYLFSKSVYETLPEDLQKGLMDASDATDAHWHNDLWPAAEVADLETMKAAGVEINTPDLAPFMELAEEINAGMIAAFNDRQMEFYNAIVEAINNY